MLRARAETVPPGRCRRRNHALRQRWARGSREVGKDIDVAGRREAVDLAQARIVPVRLATVPMRQ
jgi:hypothetical protein